MLIQLICKYPQNIVMGLSALIGAVSYAGYSICEAKKKLGKKFKFDPKKIVDTTWQSITAGVVAGTAMGCSWVGLLIAMISGIGIDKIMNKFKIKEKQIFNIVQLIAGYIKKIDKK